MTFIIKPLVGKLMLCPPNSRAVILEYDKPFWLLTKLKKEYIMRGYNKDYLKITY